MGFVIDELLKLFAHLSKGDYDSAKGRILSYYNIRACTPGLFFDRDIDNDQMKTILEQYHFFMSPKLTADGYKVLLHHGVKRDVKRYDMWAHMKYFLMTLDASLVDEDICVGYYIIFDFTFYTVGHVLKISPTGILNTCTYLQISIVIKGLLTHLELNQMGSQPKGSKSWKLTFAVTNQSNNYFPGRTYLLDYQQDTENNDLFDIFRLVFPRFHSDLHVNTRFNSLGHRLEKESSGSDVPTCPMILMELNNGALLRLDIEAIPLHIQEVFLINASSVVDIMMRSIRPFMSCVFMNKLTIIRTGDLDKLYEKVPRECLPSEYGGLLSSSAPINEMNTTKLRSLQHHFASEEAVLKTLKANY